MDAFENMIVHLPFAPNIPVSRTGKHMSGLVKVAKRVEKPNHLFSSLF